jgi:hypothetical protein
VDATGAASPRATGRMRAGRRHSAWRSFDDAGHLVRECTHVDGARHQALAKQLEKQRDMYEQRDLLEKLTDDSAATVRLAWWHLFREGLFTPRRTGGVISRTTTPSPAMMSSASRHGPRARS